MNSIQLAILEQLKLYSSHSQSGPDAKADDPFRNLLNTAGLDNATLDITEIVVFTKTHHQISFQDLTGLKSLLISVDNGPRVANEKKRSKPASLGLIGSDLTRGFEAFRPESKQALFSLEGVLRGVQYAINNLNGTLSDFRIISLRRNLLKLMQVPLKQTSISFNLVYWQGLIFLDYDWESIVERPTESRAKRLQYSGVSFERQVTGGEGSADSEFYTLVRHEINGVPIHFTAEIDASRTPNTSGLDQYVEIKTHSQASTSSSLGLKLLSTWCQNKLINCHHVVIGFRSKALRLVSIRKFDNNSIVKYLHNNPLYYTRDIELDPEMLTNWYKLMMAWFEEHSKSVVVDASCAQVYKLTFNPQKSSLDINETSNKEATTIFEETVPTWFQEYVTELRR